MKLLKRSFCITSTKHLILKVYFTNYINTNVLLLTSTSSMDVMLCWACKAEVHAVKK